MSPPPRDPHTMDLLTWEPPAVVPRFAAERVRAYSVRGRISRSVAATLADLKAAGHDRDSVAVQMSDYLGEEVSPNTLDKWAAQGSEEHRIPTDRLDALVEVAAGIDPVTAAKLLNTWAEPRGLVVIEARYLHWIEYGQIAEQQARLSRRQQAALAAAKKGGRS